MADQGGSTVGPGEYAGANVAACESQVDSRKVTSGAIKFGTGYRKGINNKKLDLGEMSLEVLPLFSVTFYINSILDANSRLVESVFFSEINICTA